MKLKMIMELTKIKSKETMAIKEKVKEKGSACVGGVGCLASLLNDCSRELIGGEHLEELGNFSKLRKSNGRVHPSKILTRTPFFVSKQAFSLDCTRY